MKRFGFDRPSVSATYYLNNLAGGILNHDAPKKEKKILHLIWTTILSYYPTIRSICVK